MERRIYQIIQSDHEKVFGCAHFAGSHMTKALAIVLRVEAYLQRTEDLCLSPYHNCVRVLDATLSYGSAQIAAAQS